MFIWFLYFVFFILLAVQCATVFLSVIFSFYCFSLSILTSINYCTEAKIFKHSLVRFLWKIVTEICIISPPHTYKTVSIDKTSIRQKFSQDGRASSAKMWQHYSVFSLIAAVLLNAHCTYQHEHRSQRIHKLFFSIVFFLFSFYILFPNQVLYIRLLGVSHFHLIALSKLVYTC